MRNIVVDANVVISGLITAGGKSASVLLAPTPSIQLVSCHFLHIELFKHKARIQQFSGLSDDDLIELLYELLSHITFVNEAYIPFSYWQQAHRLLENIDPNDTPYLALCIHLNAHLWTGDRKMISGLAEKGFDQCITTGQLLSL